MAVNENRGRTRRKATAAKPGAATAATKVLPNGSHRIVRRYSSVYFAVAAGILATGLGLGFVRDMVFQLGAIAFFLTYLVAMITRLPRLTPKHLRAHADESDIPGYLILLLALASLVGASISLFIVLNGGGPLNHFRLGLGILALALGWLTVNAMLAFHYAYEYYGTGESTPMDAEGRHSHAGGLIFPGKEMPDALSFLYFSFVVAMTAQVSDVAVSSNPMRRLVLLHGILSYFVNTVVIAVAVDVVVSLDIEAMPPTIYVDADACPVKDEAQRVAERHGAPIVFVANTGLRPSRDPMVRYVMVAAGPDAADDWIVAQAAAGDIVVTADIPLAARALQGGAHVLGPTGKPFTVDSIGMALALRDLNRHLRETGESRGLNAAFGPKDRSRFLQALDEAVRRAGRGVEK